LRVKVFNWREYTAHVYVFSDSVTTKYNNLLSYSDNTGVGLV